MQQKTVATLAIVLTLFIATSAYFYWAMTRTYAVPSIDGPYYYIQVNSILHTGTIQYADPPLTFYIFTAFTLAVGNTTTGVLVGSAIFAGAASVAVYFLFKHIFKEQIPAIAAGLVTALAAEHIAMSVNLMKNALGIVFIVGLIIFLQRLLNTEKPAKWNIVGAFGCFTLAMMTHILDEGVALLFVVGYLGFSLLLSERKQYAKRFGPILVATGLTAVLAYVLVPSYFGDFNKGIDFVSTTATALTTSQSGIGGAGGMGVTDPFVYLFLAVGIGLTVYEFFLGDKKKAVLLGTATLIGIGLVLPFIPTAYAWRFQVMEFLPVAVIMGYACSVLTRLNRKQLAIGLMVLMLVPVAYIGYQQAVMMSPTISSTAYNELTQMASSISTDNAVLLIQGSRGNDVYWPEAILNLKAVSNATTYQQQGYTVYVLVGSSQSGGMGNRPGVPTNTNNNGGFGGQGGFGGPSQGGFQGEGGSQQNSNTNTTNSTLLANATVVYNGSAYSLYKL
jgi:hypothetical protein